MRKFNIKKPHWYKAAQIAPFDFSSTTMEDGYLIFILGAFENRKLKLNFEEQMI